MKKLNLRSQYHFRKSGNDVLIWDVHRLIKLSADFEIEEIPLAAIREIDEVYWYESGDAKPTCRNIAEHAELISKADLNYPVILCHEGRVMDGMHRICKALMQGQTHICAVQFTDTPEPDFRNEKPENLIYD